MNSSSAFLVILVLVNLCHSAKLPSTFIKCDKRKSQFNGCLSAAIQDAIKQLTKPLEEYGLPSLEPYLTPKDVIAEYGNKTTGLRQKYSNISISGLTGIEKTDARLDLDRKILSLDVTFGKILFDFNYEAHGRFILLPVEADTIGSVTLRTPTFRMTFPLEEYKKGNDKYFKTEGSTILMEPKRIKFDFPSIFPNKEFNDQLIILMDENWENILQFWQLMFPRIFIQLFEGMFNNVLQKVPAGDLIDGL